MTVKELVMDGMKEANNIRKDKFSPEDLFLMRRTSLGWIPCS